MLAALDWTPPLAKLPKPISAAATHLSFTFCLESAAVVDHCETSRSMTLHVSAVLWKIHDCQHNLQLLYNIYTLMSYPY
jgi:hypothetical protein